MTKKPDFNTEIGILRTLLQDALEIEHATIPPYFTAWISIKEGHNIIPKEIVKSVMIEEMLHLSLAANLINAVGGKPNLTNPSIVPRYPHKLPYVSDEFEINIEKFSRSALETFMKIEKPEAKGKPTDCKVLHTIGQFYHCIAKKLDSLCDNHGEQRVFSGDINLQIQPEDYYGSGSLVVVKNRETFHQAITTIVDQGEGAHESIFDDDHVILGPGKGKELAHYYRFLEIYQEKHFSEKDTAETGPNGRALHVNYDLVYPLKMNTHKEKYPEGSEIRNALDGFANSYTDLLLSLEAAFNGQRSRLTEGMARMFALHNHALALIQTPMANGQGTLGLDFTPVLSNKNRST